MALARAIARGDRTLRRAAPRGEPATRGRSGHRRGHPAGHRRLLPSRDPTPRVPRRYRPAHRRGSLRRRPRTELGERRRRGRGGQIDGARCRCTTRPTGSPAPRAGTRSRRRKRCSVWSNSVPNRTRSTKTARPPCTARCETAARVPSRRSSSRVPIRGDEQERIHCRAARIVDDGSRWKRVGRREGRTTRDPPAVGHDRHRLAEAACHRQRARPRRARRRPLGLGDHQVVAGVDLPEPVLGTRACAMRSRSRVGDGRRAHDVILRDRPQRGFVGEQQRLFEALPRMARRADPPSTPSRRDRSRRRAGPRRAPAATRARCR